MSDLHLYVREKLARNAVPKITSTLGKVHKSVNPFAGLPVSPDARRNKMMKAKGFTSPKIKMIKPPTVGKAGYKSNKTPMYRRAKPPSIKNPLKGVNVANVLQNPAGGPKLPGRNQIK